MKIDLEPFKTGDDISIINTIKTGFFEEKRYHEVLILIFKDNTTGKKYKKEIVDPLYEYYICKPEYHEDYNRLFIDRSCLTSHIAKHRDLEKDICKNLGYSNWYYQNIKSGRKSDNKKIHTHPDVFFSDINIEDYYRFWFANQYKNSVCDVTKALFDIEVDTIDMKGDFPEYGECPVNAITVIFQDNKIDSYTLLLRNEKNPLIKEFETFISNNGTNELKDFVYSYVCEYRKKDKDISLGVEDINFYMAFFDDEVELISTLFHLINTRKPDFALAWNESFDLPYLIERLKKLNITPSSVICPKEFNNKISEYFIDENHVSVPKERTDKAIISSYTVYIDQMIHFASRRKQTTYPSLKLDYIGELVANVHKLDYKDITTSISLLPYKNYKVFAYYNVIDVIVQYCIEKCCEDVEYVFGKSIMNNTRYEKIHRQTVYLENRGILEFINNNLVMGNNCNKFLPKPTEKLSGAFVADPKKLSTYSAKRVNGIVTLLYDNCDDFDYKSLYPSLIRQFNIVPYNQIGKLIIDNMIDPNENRSNLSTYDRGGAFFEDMMTRQWIEICKRWFNLMGYKDMVRYIKNLFTNIYTTKYEIDNGIHSKNKLIIPIFNTQNKPIRPIVYKRDFNNSSVKNKIEEWRNNVKLYPNQSF